MHLLSIILKGFKWSVSAI